MITERLKIWILLLVVAGCGTGTALAQKMVKVSGTVYNIAENRKVPFSDVTVDVYAAKTVAVGEDMKKILDSNDQEKTLLLDQEGKTTTDENGYYEILVPDNGALIFKVGLSPSVLKEVRHQMKIDVSIDEGVMLESVTVTAMRLVLKPEPKAPKIIGNMLIPYNTFKLPPYFGNRFSRLIIQPYVLDCETNDTITFARPSVYDGKEYALTQERKMGYDMNRDPLRPYIKAEALTTRAMNLDWTDTIIVPDPNRNYSCFAIVNLEDYSASNSRTYQINTCQTKRPMKFLQYNLFSEQMDPLQHKERAQIEKRNTSDKIQLSFLINSDQLTDTPENKQSLAMLRNKLKEIAESPGTVLKEFHVAGTASPDGHYSSNLSLAERRMRKIEQEITSILPQYTLERVYRNPHAEVAPWEEVVKLLERDGKLMLLALPVAERWLKQVQLTPGENAACAQPLLIPVRLKISPEETRVLQRAEAQLAQMGIEIVLEPQHVTIRAVPLPLRQQNLQNLIPELIGYLAQQTSFDAANTAQWIARHLASEHAPWSMAQAISVLAEVERLCPHLVKAPPGGLLQPVDLQTAMTALKHD